MKTKILTSIFACTVLCALVVNTAWSSDLRWSYNVESGTPASITTYSIAEYKIEPTDDDAFNFAYMGSVAIDGDNALVGSYSDGAAVTSGGSAYIFNWDGSSWTQKQKLFASDVEEKDWFGKSVDIQGDIAVVGAPGYSYGATTPGSVYVIRHNGTNWIEEQILNPSDGANEDQFGTSVSVDGDYILIGASAGGADPGKAYVFYHNGTSWEEQAILTPDDQYLYDYFGGHVSLKGNIAVVSNTSDNDKGDAAGAVYVFERSGTSWTQTQKITAADGAAMDNFGFDVSFDGGTIAVCSPAHSSYLGKIYTFVNDGNSWSQNAFINGTVANNYFGYNVSVDQGRLLAGEREDNTKTSKAGLAKVYLFDGSDWLVDTTYYASDAGFYDYFGCSVDIDGENSIIGAYSENAAYIYQSTSGSELVADFSADITTGTASLTVQFTDASTGTTSSWAWDFDNDGTTDATTQNPTYTYSIAGTYTVSLTVSDGTNSDSETKVDYITVNAASGSDVYASLPFSEDFEGDWINNDNTRDVPSGNWTNTPSSGSDSWRRDDDGVASGSWGSLSGSYTPAGANSTAHSARFHSFGASSGLKGTLDLHIDLSSNGSKELSFWYINDAGSDVLEVYLSTDGGANFGNSLATNTTTSTWQKVTIDLTSYTTSEGVIRFEATSDYGYSDIGLDEVSVSGSTPAISADFSTNIVSGVAPLTVNFTDASTGTPSSWAWDFDNEGTTDATIQNPSYTFNTAGTYTVSLTVSDGTNSDTEVKSNYISVSEAGDSETENNDSYDLANAFGASSSITGNIDNVDDYYDWFKVSIPYDGSLTFVSTSEASLDLSLALYDVDGTSYLHGCNVCGGIGENDTIYQHNLNAGTYYVQLSGTGSGSYTLSNIFVETTLPDGNDSEPNTTYDVAIAMDVNGSNTGHIGFFSNGETDFYDWYKVSIPYDGSLTFASTSEASLDLSLALYDVDGASYLHGCNVCGEMGENDTIYQHNLKAGTYYLQLSASGYGSYTLANVFEETTLPDGNDSEPNTTYDVAIAIDVNGSNTGHIGFFSNGETDFYDWYKVSIPYDGSLTFASTSEASLDLSLALYDVDGASYLHGCNVCGEMGENDTIYQHNLKAGTYYLQLSASGYGSYTLANVFVPTSIPEGDDTEPNDTFDAAISMELNGSKTGHIGFFSNGETDFYDWYSVTVSAGDEVDFIGSSDALLDLNLNLYDTDGTSFMYGCTDCGGLGENDTLSHEFLMSGTYYLQLSATGYGSYTLSNELIPAITANFTADVTTGEAPLTVAFTDLTHGAISWSWSFGDGNTSDDQNAIHTYATTGSYDVTLVASDGTNTDTETKTSYINVIEPITPGEWTAMTSGTSSHLNSLSFIDEFSGMISGVSGTILNTTDGTNNLVPLTTGQSVSINDVHFVNSTIAYGVGSRTVDFDEVIIKTSDGGASWTLLDPGDAVDHRDLHGVYFVDANNGYVVGKWGTILKTSDGGTSWTRQAVGADHLLDVFFTSSTTGFIVGNNSTILKTTDGGVTWVSKHSGSSGLACVQFIDENTGFVVGLAGSLLKTTDAGENWSSPHDYWSLSDYNFSTVFFTDASTGYLAGSVFGENHILQTIDGGASWTSMYNPTSYIKAIQFPTSEVGYAVGDDGLVLKYVVGEPEGTVTASFTADVTSGDLPLIVTFTDASTATNTTITSWAWDFDNDGTTDATDQNSSYTYSAAGTYTVSLTVSDGTISDSEIKTNYITVNASSSTVQYASLPFSEDFENGWIDDDDVRDVPSENWVNTPSHGSDSWRRDEDGVASGGWGTLSGEYSPTGANSTSHSARFHTFGADAGLKGTLDLYIDFSTISGSKELSFWYNNSDGTDVLNVFISTDGGASFGSSLTTETTTSGWENVTIDLTSYSSSQGVIRFEAISDYGYSDIGLDEISISAPTASIGADFSAPNTDGLAPLSVDFTDASLATNTTITSWAWDFDNDGTTDATTQNPSHTYNEAGTYTVSLSITDGTNSDIETKVDYITVIQSLTADFTADFTSGTAPLTVQFTDATTGDPTSWEWDFNGDGVVDATVQNPSYVFEEAGVYSVKLVVSNAFDLDELVIEDLVEVTDEGILSAGYDELSIYPNPASDVITFYRLEENATVRILNTDGKILVEQQLNMNNIMNIIMLRPGLYIVQIEGSSGIITRKLIKE